MAHGAARRLPPAHRERYEGEWLAELAAYCDRPLTALIAACRLWLGAPAMTKALGETTGENATQRVSLVDRLVAAGLLFALVPVLFVISLFIALGSRGPVFLRRQSVRPDGRSFNRLSFQTISMAPKRPVLGSTPGAEALGAEALTAWIARALRDDAAMPRKALENAPRHERADLDLSLPSIWGTTRLVLEVKNHLFGDPQITPVGQFLIRTTRVNCPRSTTSFGRHADALSLARRRLDRSNPSWQFGGPRDARSRPARARLWPGRVTRRTCPGELPGGSRRRPRRDRKAFRGRRADR